VSFANTINASTLWRLFFFDVSDEILKPNRPDEQSARLITTWPRSHRQSGFRIRDEGREALGRLYDVRRGVGGL
jgi:hypothetical protein